MHPERWLQAAGLGTWLAASIPAVAGVATGRLGGLRLALWAVASLAFVGAFAGMCWAPVARRSRGAALALRAAQAMAALVMVAAGRDGGAAGVLLVVVAGQLLPLLSPGVAAAWILAQTVALIAVLGLFADPLRAITYGSAFGGFQLFALGTASLAARERRAREALATANAELHATRALMAENSRAAERLRISRDLHDTLGHHLTALSLQLDVATRLTEGKAADHVGRAHALTRLLLADVRDVVGQLRGGGRLDLASAVRALVAEPPGELAIHLEAPDVIVVDDDAQALALLRCVQEIVTNAARHGQARNLWLSIAAGADGVTLRGRDDGHGAAVLTWGHGLTGMRERFEAHAGRLEVTTGAGQGLEVRGFMPRAKALS